jgi:hypothetical protein
MPHRRPILKGSFSGHFDELTKHFAHAPKAKGAARATQSKPKRKPKQSIHQALLDRSVR